MDKKIVLVKTGKGRDEVKSKTNYLFGDIKRVMALVDDKSTVAELTKRAAPSLRASLDEMLQELLDGEFVQDKDKVSSGVDRKSSAIKMATPKMFAPKMSTPPYQAKPPAQMKNAGDELNFTQPMPVPTAQELAAEAARLKAEQDAERGRVESETKARAEAEARGRQEAETKARVEAEKVRLRAEQQAERAREELLAAQAKAKMEAEAHAAAEAARHTAMPPAQPKGSGENLDFTQSVRVPTAQDMAAEAARLKAEQDAARAREELAAVQAREKVGARLLAEAEARARQVVAAQPKVAPSAQLVVDGAVKAKADKEAHKLAEAQAKVWSEAEQRAKTQVLAQAQLAEAKQQLAQQAEKVAQAQPVRRVAKKRGKPLPWGKAGIGLFMVFLLLAILLPYVWPMQDYVVQIEQRLSAQLHQPVRVGHLRATLLPLPKLELQGVTVGKSQELKASKVELHFDLPALLTETRIITRAEISELAINAQSFDQALSWLQAASGETRYPVMRMVLQQARVSGDGLGLPVVNGVLDLDGQGKLIKAVLKSADGKLGVELQPQQSRWQIALTIKDSALPLLPDITFNELNLNGEVDAGTASFNQIDGRLYGGKLAGSARLTWRNGWQVQGNINVKTLDLGDALPQFGITGELDGDAAFILRGAKLPMLAKSPHLEGKFVVKKGLIGKVDMVETVRMPDRQEASGGRTHFDELSGALEVDNNSKHLRQIRISAGIMSANGDVDIAPDKQVSGQMNVSLKVRAERGSVPLVVSGTLAEPVWRVGR